MKKHTSFALICLPLLFAISLVAQTNPSASKPTAAVTPPAIPEEARKHFVIGTTIFKEAKTADDFAQVVSEFKQAADLASQWPEARYNLALAKEAAGDYSGAMADLRLYQQFKLSESEARTVQDKIYALEAKAGLEAKKRVEQQKAAAAEEQNKRDYWDKIGFLAGTWNATMTQIGGAFNGQKSQFQDIITVTGKSVLISHKEKGYQILKGTMEGEDYTTIKWIKQEERYPDLPIDVTIDRRGLRIHWEEPYQFEGRTNSYTWSHGKAQFELTK